MLNFTLENCNAGETVGVAITLSQNPPTDGIAYKYQGGQWRVISDATISGKTISYNLTDNGPLDADPTSTKISDPVAVAVPTGVPDAPTNLSGSVTNGVVDIAFDLGSDGGEAITGFKYSIDGVTFKSVSSVPTASSVRISLPDDKDYFVNLKAVNINGDSPASGGVSFTLPAEPRQVLLPAWLLGLLIVLIGWGGYRRLKMLGRV
jgi:hypothetical protein